MRFIYYFKFMIYSSCAIYTKNVELRIGFILLAMLMLSFATQLAIEEYIDKKFDNKEEKPS